MSLKELKRLAPWQWESKIATKKHKIGPKGLEEWEQVRSASLYVCERDGALQPAPRAWQLECCCAQMASSKATACMPTNSPALLPVCVSTDPTCDCGC